MTDHIEFLGEIHPLADFFAMLPGDELQELADDIATNGQKHPIVLDALGRLVDGRNRLAACERVGIKPRFVVRDDIETDEQAAALIRSENNRRRNQTTGQQAATEALLLEAMNRRKDGRWRDGVLTDQNLDRTDRAQRVALAQAGFILDNNRALLLKVAAGYPISKAYDETKEAQEAAEEEAKRMDTLRNRAPDLMRLITEDGMALAEVWSAYLTRTEKERLQAEADAERARKNNDALRRAIHNTLAYANPDRRAERVSEWDGWGEKGDFAVTATRIKQAADALTALSKEWSKK